MTQPSFDKPARLSIPFRIGLIALILGITSLFGLLGFWLVPKLGIPETPMSTGAPIADRPGAAILLVALIGFVAIGGLVFSGLLYWLAVASNFMIDDYLQPFMPKFKTRVWLAQTFLPFPALIGTGLLSAMGLAPLLRLAGLGGQTSFLVATMAVIVLAQIPLSWVNLWCPIERSLIRKRLQALGIGPEHLQKGRLVGISNPDVSSFKKPTIVEDDLGMLWIAEGSLQFMGDLTRFEIPRERVVSIDQKADAGNTASLAGASNVIITYEDADRSRRHVRFHVEGVWTLSAKARQLDHMAYQLREWLESRP